jgi:hypothetical protein
VSQKRFPWNVVKGFSVESRADGTLLILPVYYNPRQSDEEGGGPGLFTRMALADWCFDRLQKRTRAASTSSAPTSGTL